MTKGILVQDSGWGIAIDGVQVDPRIPKEDVMQLSHLFWRNEHLVGVEGDGFARRMKGWKEFEESAGMLPLKVLIDDARGLIGPFSLYGRLHTTMAKTTLQGEGGARGDNGEMYLPIKWERSIQSYILTSMSRPWNEPSMDPSIIAP